MEHPLITNIDHLTIDELQSKISELTKKLGIAHRLGNAHLRMQIQMALETYQAKYQEKQKEIYDRSSKNNGPDFSEKINIS
jgi:hypothetical protein